MCKVATLSFYLSIWAVTAGADGRSLRLPFNFSPHQHVCVPGEEVENICKQRDMQFFFILNYNSFATIDGRLFLELFESLMDQQSISVQVPFFFFLVTALYAFRANILILSVYLQYGRWPAECLYCLCTFSNFMLYLFYAPARLEI